MAIIPVRIRRGVEWHLKNANCIRAKAFADAEVLRNKAEEHKDNETGIRGKGGHSDRVSHAAICLAEADRILRQAPLWMDVVDETRAFYEGSKRLGEFYRLYYDVGASQDTIAQRMGVEKTTIYDWRTEIVTRAAMLALEKGLVKLSGAD